MIKPINRNSLLTTPFVAAKSWELYNIENPDLVLIETSSLAEEISVALEYIDYTGNPIINRVCNIALEQQETDVINYEEGLSGSGFFYPDSEPKNQTGTFKRLVHDQITKAFYNQYRNPLEIFGMENIDFPLSQTNRYISDKFLLFTIPRDILGDKMSPGTIKFFDTLMDDNVSISDDGNENLFAGTNLFSKVQEVRSLGNIIEDGFTTNTCLSPISIILQNGILWMQADDGNYYEIQCTLSGLNTTLLVGQVPSSPPFSGLPYVVFRSTDSNLYKWSLFIDTGSIINYKIERLSTFAPYVLSIDLISSDLSFHTVGMMTYGITTTLNISQ